MNTVHTDRKKETMNMAGGKEMVKVRQDAWLEENDILLAETVLRHVREGSTQLSAFEEVGDAASGHLTILAAG